MVQDAPLSGVELSVPFLVRLAHEIREVAYFKIEMAQAAAKLRALIPTRARTERARGLDQSDGARRTARFSGTPPGPMKFVPRATDCAGSRRVDWTADTES